MQQNSTDVIAVLDADFLMYYCCHNKKGEQEKTLEMVLATADDFIRSIFNDVKATHYIGALTIGKCFRYVVYPDYKAGRWKLEKPKYFNELRDHLIASWGFIHYLGLEADDIVNISKNYYYDNTIVVSNDKDLIGLIGRFYNPIKKEFHENTEEVSNKNFWTSMITGDSTDNVKGLEGKGKVYAKEIFDEYQEFNEGLMAITLNHYIMQYGEYEGIDKFYRNYMALKILDEPKYDFIVPEPIEYRKDIEIKELFN